MVVVVIRMIQVVLDVRGVVKVNWKLLYKSALRALKWYIAGWFAVALISIVGVMSMIQNEINPWVFRPFAVLMYIAVWVIFYKITNKKENKSGD